MKTYVHGGDVYRNPNVLDFSANINPLGTPPAVLEAARKSMGDIQHYPDASKEKLREKLACKLKMNPERLIFGNGAAELIFSLVWAEKPEKALVPVPTFAEYEQALSASGCRISRHVLREDRGFRLGEDFLKRLDQEGETPDLVFLCNPNNPTGLLIEPELLQRIVRVCGRRGIRLVVDECFLDFVPSPERHTLLPMTDAFPELFLLRAFTKTYAMAGLRLGFGISSDQGLLERMENCMQPWNVSLPAQEAGAAALDEEAYVMKSREIVFQESRFLKRGLRTLGYPVYDSQANYLFFYGEEWLGRRLLDEGIMVRDCGNYPGLGNGYYRIAVKIREENERLLKAVRKVKEEWQKQL